MAGQCASIEEYHGKYVGDIGRTRNNSPDFSTIYSEETRNNQLVMLRKEEPSVHSFENEREILYQILFDLRRDVTELKKLVHEQHTIEPQPAATPVTYYPTPTLEVPSAEIQDPEEYIEESLSLGDLEREMIKRALEKNHGKRKNAARDLDISERTLYRKIKEYGLE
jgi:DNA-binding NtrC family response regulator